MTAKEEIEVRRKALEELDAALANEVKRNGPMLIWAGHGEFPRERCAFRGLSVPLSERLGLKPEGR